MEDETRAVDPRDPDEGSDPRPHEESPSGVPAPDTSPPEERTDGDGNDSSEESNN